MAIMPDGFSTIISLADGVVLKEKESTPPGLDGGGPIDTTTMRNTAYRTMEPKALITLLESGMTCAYDPAALTSVLAAVNVNQFIDVTFPDGAKWSFWGWLDKFTPNASVEGEQPTAEVVIQPSNVSNLGVETPPAFTAAP